MADTGLIIELKDKWEAARKGAQDLLTEYKGREGEMDHATREKLGKFIDEADNLRGAFELKSKDAELAKWEQTPVTMLGNNIGTPGVARVEGIYGGAGNAYVERKENGTYLITQDGEGLLGDETLRGIRQPEYKAAFGRYLRGKASTADRMLFNDIETKAGQEGLDPSGGYLAPEDFINRLIARTMAPMGLAAKVDRIPTSRDSVVLPKVNYLAENDSPANIYPSPARVTWTGEIPAASTTSRTTDTPYGLSRIPVFTAMISLPLTRDMVEDAAFPIIAKTNELFGYTIQILYDNMVLNGSGISQPRGLLSNPGGSVDKDPAVVNSGAASSLTWDGLQDLAYTLPPQYDNGAIMVFNKNSTARAIAGLVDGNARPFWGMGIQDSGFSDRALGRPLLGYDVLIHQLMPNVGSSAFPIILGNFSGYSLVERIGFSVQQLNELYAETNQIVLLGRLRFGGDILEPWKFKVQKCST